MALLELFEKIIILVGHLEKEENRCWMRKNSENRGFFIMLSKIWVDLNALYKG